MKLLSGVWTTLGENFFGCVIIFRSNLNPDIPKRVRIESDCLNQKLVGNKRRDPCGTKSADNHVCREQRSACDQSHQVLLPLFRRERDELKCGSLRVRCGRQTGCRCCRPGGNRCVVNRTLKCVVRIFGAAIGACFHRSIRQYAESPENYHASSCRCQAVVNPVGVKGEGVKPGKLNTAIIIPNSGLDLYDNRNSSASIRGETILTP